jgi:hypothetical protein
MLTINHYHKLAHKEVSGVNGVMYTVASVIETDNFYTFVMHSNTHAGFSQTIRLCRYSDEMNWKGTHPVYKFLDCESVRVTADWIKDMDNIIHSIESAIKIKTHNPTAMQI